MDRIWRNLVWRLTFEMATADCRGGLALVAPRRRPSTQTWTWEAGKLQAMLQEEGRMRVSLRLSGKLIDDWRRRTFPGRPTRAFMALSRVSSENGTPPKNKYIWIRYLLGWLTYRRASQTKNRSRGISPRYISFQLWNPVVNLGKIPVEWGLVLDESQGGAFVASNHRPWISRFGLLLSRISFLIISECIM